MLHQCHVLAAEMVHFVQQVQYYINFEVLACAWDELLQRVTRAEDLDCVIAAHEAFLDTVISKVFIDQNSAVSTHTCAHARTHIQGGPDPLRTTKRCSLFAGNPGHPDATEVHLRPHHQFPGDPGQVVPAGEPRARAATGVPRAAAQGASREDQSAVRDRAGSVRGGGARFDWEGASLRWETSLKMFCTLWSNWQR